MSSFYDDASLVVIPSGYKTSKVYAEKPTDGSGDLTFTRTGDTATRVNSAGLIEKVRTNLVTFSESFDNAAWTKSAAATTITANSTISPSGYQDADTWTINSAGSRYVYQTKTLTAGAVTASFFVKKGTSDWFAMYLVDGGSSAGFTFNVSDGTLGSAVSPSLTPTASIQDYGNGWYRCVLTATVVGTSIEVRGYVATSSSTVSASVGASVICWGAQLETNDVATDYIPTTTAAVSVGPVANVPRLDYLGSTCGKLLLEPQRTNLVTYSEQMDNAAWTKTGVTISANATTSPDGYASADKIVGAASGGDKTTFQLISITIGQAFTISAFFKKSEYKLAFVRAGGQTGSPYVIYNLDTQAVVSTSGASSTKIEDYGNGWYRISFTLNSATGGTCAPNLSFLPDSGYTLTAINVPQYTGDGTSGGFIWGCQLEANGAAYATSYIPTLGAAVTRGADFMYKASLGSAIFGTTDGVVFLETGQCYNNADTSATKDFISVEKDGSNWFGIGSGGSSAAPTIRFVTRIAGVVSTDAEPSGLSNAKIAIKYSAANFKIFVNGSLQATVAKSIGNYQDVYFMVNSADDLTMPLKQFLVFPTALSDADCIALTA